MYLYEYEKRKNPMTILYNPIFGLTLDYINGKWWFVDRLSNYGYEGFIKYYPLCIYEPTEADEDSNAWIELNKFIS